MLHMELASQRYLKVHTRSAWQLSSCKGRPWRVSAVFATLHGEIPHADALHMPCAQTVLFMMWTVELIGMGFLITALVLKLHKVSVSSSCQPMCVVDIRSCRSGDC